MNKPSAANKKPAADISTRISAKAQRKLHARRQGQPAVWLGLGMMGLIGWSVVVPTLLGALLGVWLDTQHPGQHSWTLALLMAGLTLGCFNAWHWVDKEDRAIAAEQARPPEDNEQNDDTKH
jgi:ATP synthase protein I